MCLGRGLGLIPPQKYSDTSQSREQDQTVTEEAQRTEGQLTDRSEWLEPVVATDPGTGLPPLKVHTEAATSVSGVFRSLEGFRSFT